MEWKSWPGVTIALVFAALFLEVPEKKEGPADIKPVVAQTSMVFIAILGQMVLGIILSLVLFQPVFGLPLSFASVLEARWKRIFFVYCYGGNLGWDCWWNFTCGSKKKRRLEISGHNSRVH